MMFSSVLLRSGLLFCVVEMLCGAVDNLSCLLASERLKPCKDLATRGVVMCNAKPPFIIANYFVSSEWHKECFQTKKIRPAAKSHHASPGHKI
ncbi:hypothetical protein BKA93DRAFT_357320 [Sparassis latifolia]